MDSERMARVDALFEQALDLPETERTDFLSQVTDEELRREVVELLRFAGDDGTLDHLGSRVRDLAAGETMQAKPDRRVGSYRLVEEIGSGGMGVVYLAERADGAFESRVALKLLPAGSLPADAVRLFERERQILARLSHEHIARLLDGGVDSLGRPFLAMELVEGLPIDRYCDERRLDLAARLRLFETVCRAVQYAHQNLVVHRDLKPGNILVKGDGVVKLLDFGIAKVVRPAEEGAAEEGHSLGLLSPSHASPEQIEKRPVTTASDVYSLGVVLFQLVAGRLPYENAGGVQPLFAQILEGEAPAASASIREDRAALRGTTVPRLRRRVAGDLDAVLAKALAPEPERRYPTAEQLGDDVRRFLAGLPVAARPHSAVYRLRKWVGRHAVAAALAALAVTAVSTGLVASLWQAREATRARATAEKEAAVARGVSEVLVDVFERANPDPASEEVIVATLLEPAAARIQGDLAGSPEVQAALMDALGRAYLRLGRYSAARPLAEEALALRLRLYPRLCREVALSQRLLGQLLVAYGELDRAAALMRESLATLEAVAADEPLEIAEAETLLSHTLGVLGDDEGCELLRRRSLARYRRHLGERNPEVAQALNNLANALVRRGKAREAEALLRQAVAMHRDGVGGDAVAYATVLNNLAQARLDAGRLADAEAAAREAGEASLRAYGPKHPNLALAFDTLARVLAARGAVAEAEPLARLALEVYAQGNPGGRTRTALIHGTLAETALLRGDLGEAEARFKTGRDLLNQVTPPRHVAHALMRSLEGRLRAAQGRDREAQRALAAAFDELRRRQAPESLALRQTAAALVDLYEKRGDLAAARRYRSWVEPPPS
ncbi:MAG TPA: serine/threonine-protein kinase [Thermoanaerobaculia bacterium]